MNTTVPLQAAPEPSAPPDRARAAQDGRLAGVASRADEFGAAQALPQVRHLRQALEESGGRQSALRLEECDGRSALPAGALLLPGGPGEEPNRRMKHWHVSKCLGTGKQQLFVLAASTDIAAMESPHPREKADDEGGRMQGRQRRRRSPSAGGSSRRDEMAQDGAPVPGSHQARGARHDRSVARGVFTNGDWYHHLWVGHNSCAKEGGKPYSTYSCLCLIPLDH